jgi:hypothetical protein
MTTCHGCRKQISGDSITALGQTWHAVCFRCAGCGRPIGEKRFGEHENRPYHAQCYHERFSPRCAGCGQPITGTCTTALGKTWHPEHFVCAHCRRPFAGGRFRERDGRPYCERDFQELFGRRCAAGKELIGQRRFIEKDGKTYCEDHYWQLFGKRCAIGNEILKGEYTVNSWNETYCEAHAKGLPTCYSCQRVICDRMTGGGVRYGDGRSMCNRCRRSAIDQPAQSQPVLLKVRKSLARLGLDIGQIETPLQLADQQELNRRSSKSYSKQPAGMACHSTVTRNGQVIERRVDAILILHGLPQEHFAAIAAHELCHSYLFINEFPELQPSVEEGLCELTKHLWLTQQKTPEAAFRLKLLDNNDDPIYGDGYRAARRGLDRMPLDGLLQHVRRYGRLPT